MPAISAACVERRADMLRSEGRDPDALLDDLRQTPHANELLRRFVRTYVGATQHQSLIN